MSEDVATRRERARDVLRTLSGSEQGARALETFFEGRGAVGELAMLVGAGEIWARDDLRRRDRSVVVISMLAALGRERELEQHLAGGLHHGLSPDELDEIVLQIAVYAGLPFGLAASGVAERVMADRAFATERAHRPAPLAPKPPAARRAAGLDVLKTLLGAPELDLEATETSILEQQGAIGELVMDYAFGDVWSRPGLSRRDRSLVVISVLTALHLPHELEIHLAGALHHGVTPGEIEAVLLTAVAYCGFPRAIDGMLLARKVFAAAGVSTGSGSGTGTARRVDLDSGDEEGRPA